MDRGPGNNRGVVIVTEAPGKLFAISFATADATAACPLLRGTRVPGGEEGRRVDAVAC